MTIEIVSRPVLAAAVEASDQKQLELGYHSRPGVPARSTGRERLPPMTQPRSAAP
jgi:hypothetical protein